jgi:hypothetical protein
MSGIGQPFEDDELVELLDRRAGRAKVDPALIGRVAAEALASRQQRLGWWQPALRSFTPARKTAASVVAMLAVVSLVGTALFVGGGARSTPSPSRSPGPQVAQTTSVRFTSVEFLRLLREQPSAFLGHTILVDGTLGDILESCARPTVDCPALSFGGAGAADGPLVLPADHAVRAAIGPGAVSLSGTFAIEVRSASELALLGNVRLSRSRDFWRPSEVAGVIDSYLQSLYPVEGWVARGMAMTCPKPVPDIPSGRPSYGCPDNDWLTDEAYQPWRNGGDVPPASGIYLPGGTYDATGPTSPPTGPPFPPRHGVYLLRTASPCPPGPTCPEQKYSVESWSIVTTLDPVLVSVPAASAEADPSGIAEPVVLSEADLKHELDANGSAFVANILLVRGSIQTAKPCKAVNCPTGAFESLGSSVGVFDGGDQPNFPVSGILAVRIVDTHAVGFVGRLVPNDARIAWRPLELAGYGPPKGADLYAVTGWLVPREAATCPPDPASGQGACDARPAQLVDDEATARTLLGGQKVESLLLESVASDVEPTDADPGTYLVRAAAIPPCGPNADCFAPPDAPIGLIVDARVDPLRGGPRSTPTSRVSSAVPTAPPASAAAHWRSITILPPVSTPFIGEGNEFVNDVTAFGDGFVAAGYLYSLKDGHRTGQIWISPDGRSWERTAPTELDNVAVDHIVVAGGRLLAHGVSGAIETKTGDGRLFVSDDARAWTEVIPTVMGSDPYATVVGGPAGFVGVARSGNGFEWTAWQSADGSSWAAAPLPSVAQGSDVRLFGSPTGYALGITAGSELANPWPTVHDRRAMIATSDDVTSWQVGEIPGATGVANVFAGATGLVATGSEGYCSSCLSPQIGWRSGDGGATWQPLAPALTFRDSVLAGQGRIFIWSLDSRNQLYRLRQSTDGISWSEVAVFQAQNAPGDLIGLAVGPNGIAGFEQTSDHPAHQLAVFMQPGPPPPGATRPTAAPEPSDQPCVSPMPRDSDGACGP